MSHGTCSAKPLLSSQPPPCKVASVATTTYSRIVHSIPDALDHKCRVLHRLKFRCPIAEWPFLSMEMSPDQHRGANGSMYQPLDHTKQQIHGISKHLQMMMTLSVAPSACSASLKHRRTQPCHIPGVHRHRHIKYTLMIRRSKFERTCFGSCKFSAQKEN